MKGWVAEDVETTEYEVEVGFMKAGDILGTALEASLGRCTTEREVGVQT